MEKMESFGVKETKGRALFNEVQVKGDSDKAYSKLFKDESEDRDEKPSPGEYATVEEGVKENKDLSALEETLVKVNSLVVELKLATQIDDNDEKIISIAEDLAMTATVALNLESKLLGKNLGNLDDLIIDIKEFKNMLGVTNPNIENNLQQEKMSAFGGEDKPVLGNAYTEHKLDESAKDTEDSSNKEDITKDVVHTKEKSNMDINDEQEDSLLSRPYSNILRQLSRKVLSPDADTTALKDKLSSLDLDTIPSSQIRGELHSYLHKTEIKSGKDLNDVLTLSSLLKLRNLK